MNKIISDKLPSIGVAIVAPSGYALEPTQVARAVAWFEAQGCLVKNFANLATRHLRFSDVDEARILQLHQAAADPDTQLVIALRGGYGLSRILPQLDMPLLAASGKLFVGYSDFTALNLALLAQTGTGSFAGPTICGDFAQEEISQFTAESFWQCLKGPEYSIQVQAPDCPTANVSGQLWGGNLTMLTHLLGSPWFPKIDGGILFIEDINEHPYRIERMLLQLLHAGVLARQSAILLGDFSGYRLGENDNGYDFAAMLGFLRTRISIPILTGLPFGHIRHKLTLPVGSQAQLNSHEQGWILRMYQYHHLSA